MVDTRKRQANRGQGENTKPNTYEKSDEDHQEEFSAMETPSKQNKSPGKEKDKSPKQSSKRRKLSFDEEQENGTEFLVTVNASGDEFGDEEYQACNSSSNATKDMEGDDKCKASPINLGITARSEVASIAGTEVVDSEVNFRTVRKNKVNVTASPEMVTDWAEFLKQNEDILNKTIEVKQQKMDEENRMAKQVSIKAGKEKTKPVRNQLMTVTSPSELAVYTRYMDNDKEALDSSGSSDCSFNRTRMQNMNLSE